MSSHAPNTRRRAYWLAGAWLTLVNFSSLPAQELKPRLVLGEDGHNGRVESIAFSPDGKLLASGEGSGNFVRGNASGTVRVWDIATGKELAVLKGHRDWVTTLAFSPDAKTLATGGSFGDKTVRLWDTITFHEKAVFQGLKDRVGTVAFSPDGRTLATAAGSVQLWDVATEKARSIVGEGVG